MPPSLRQVVSARLDTDGVAATRDPSDLIGRGAVTRQAALGDVPITVEVVLQGRGPAGKFATAKQK